MSASTRSQRPRQWTRLGLEGATIVVSILIAFVIDAWWGGRTHDQLILQQQTQLFAQLSANAEALRIAEADGSQASEAMLVLVESIQPNPTLITADSLASLLDRSFRIDPPALETGALEAILSQGDLAATIDTEVLGWLMTFRTVSEAYATESIAWEATRTTLIEYVASIAPLSYVLDQDRDELELTRFGGHLISKEKGVYYGENETTVCAGVSAAAD